MDAYLVKFGVGLARRQFAKAWTPQPWYHVARGRLCITMPTPLGTRVEWLHPGGPPEIDRDPAGHVFTKTVAWDGAALVSTFKSEELSDVVTRRWVERHGSTERLLQETTFEGVSFTRTFELVEDSTKAPLL